MQLIMLAFNRPSLIRNGYANGSMTFSWTAYRIWNNRMGFMTMVMMGYRSIHTSTPKSKVLPSNLKGKGKSSQEWLTRHLNDPYVKKAQELNYRARSAFKLIEIDDKAKILKPGLTVVECGAAPGAWTQVIVNRINSDGKDARKKTGTVIGIDLLSIAPVKGAILLPGCDFTSPKTLEQIREILTKRDEAVKDKEVNAEGETTPSDNKAILTPTIPPQTDAKNKTDPLVDINLSDMAPNSSGQRETDHYRIIKLVESALIFAIQNGKPGGHFLVKVWDGSEIQKLERVLSKYYDKVSRQKPPCSRNDSAEMFILGKFKK